MYVTIGAIVVFLICFIGVSALFLYDEYQLEKTKKPLAPNPMLRAIYVKEMNNDAKELIDKTIDALQTNGITKIVINEARHGLSIVTSIGLIVEVYDMSLKCNESFKLSRPATAIIDQALTPLETLRIINSLEATPRILFFEHE